MRKILIITLIVILIVSGYFMIIDGLNIFGLNILSIQGIKEENDRLDSKLEQVSTLTSTDYPTAINNLNESSKQLALEKTNYADLVSFSSGEDITAASQLEKYEMEYLWTKIGNHATKNKVVLKIDVKTSSTGTPNAYDLDFTATGEYVSISEFIASLEDDSSLAFKIENFKLLPKNEDSTELQAMFTVRDLSININRISESTQSTTDTRNTDTVNSVINDIEKSTSNDINYSNN